MKNSWLKRSLTEDEPVDKYSFLPTLISWEGSSEKGVLQGSLEGPSGMECNLPTAGPAQERALD